MSAAHYDLRFAKPLDEELLLEVGAKFRRVVTVEDGALRGGVGEAVAAFSMHAGWTFRCVRWASATSGSNTELRLSSMPSAAMTRRVF
ncbi:MAG: transketolase C-terminal domain-containing protein [Alistipes sp.]